MAAVSPDDSSCLEKLLEHRLIADVGTALWTAGVRDFEVLRSEIDLHGHDIVIEAAGVLRHIQLKMTMTGGKRSRITVNRRLSGKPSGCVVWATYDPDTLGLGPFRWFGDEPGKPLPDLGTRIAKHSKGNAGGEKLERPRHRVLNRGQFAMLESADQLVEALFGTV